MKNIDGISNSELSNLIDEWIRGRNAERNRLILKRRLIDGLTYEQLAEEFDLSYQHISSIVYKSQNKLFSHIT